MVIGDDFIGYKEGEIVKPLCILTYLKLPQNGAKNMSFVFIDPTGFTFFAIMFVFTFNYVISFWKIFDNVW